MHPIRVPRINANEDEVELVEWLHAEGDHVRAGEIVCTLETTKAVVELSAEADGFLRALAPAGTRLAVGARLAVLTETAEEPIPAEEEAAAGESHGSGRGSGATRKAQIVATRLGVDIDALMAARPGERITEADVEAAARGRLREDPTSGELVEDAYPANRPQRIVIVGAGRAAVQVLDALSRRHDQRAVAIVDDSRPPGPTMMGTPILGPVSLAAELVGDGRADAAIVALGSPAERAVIQAELAGAGVRFANVIDPDAMISALVTLGEGNFISAAARLGPCATLGDGNFVSAMCSLEHHNVVGSFCHFGPAVVTSGSVRIGDRVQFGTGIHVEPDLEIGDDCLIASGTTLTSSVPAGSAVKSRQGPLVRPR